MGPTLSALRELQLVENDLSTVRRKLRARKRGILTQQGRLQTHRDEYDALHQSILEHRKDADTFELDIKDHEARIEKLRGDLNCAKSNKEYATILTDINNHKADKTRLEEEELKILNATDLVKEESDKIEAQIAEEEKLLAELTSSNADEVARLEGMLAELTAKRAEAAKEIAPDVLLVFTRMAEKYDGEAMAVVEVSGKAPRNNFTCGGCFMTLNAEHANALRTRDKIRQCDNCQRILFVE